MSYRFADISDPIAMDEELMAAIDFGEEHARSPDPRRFTLGLPSLNPTPPIETWRVERVVATGWDDDIGYVEGTDLMLVHHLVQESDHSRLAQTTCDLYRDLLALLDRRGFPHLLRVWNFIESIHASPDGVERYQAFSAGRARAFDRHGLDLDRIPAASAIGTTAPGLMVYALAARTPGHAIENPRQLPAYRYPPEYGARPPYFARATRASLEAKQTLFLSGTASVVGHLSLHPGNPAAQLDETLRNLESLMLAAGEAPYRRPQRLRVYLRPPLEPSWMDVRLRDWTGPETSILYLRGEICRRDLEIEIEGQLQS